METKRYFVQNTNPQIACKRIIPFQIEIQMTQSFPIYINSTRKALNSKHQRLNLIMKFMLINNVIEIVSEWNTRHLFPQTNNSMSCLLFGNDHCRFHKSIFKRNSFTLGISNFRNSSSNRFIFTGILVKEK